MTDSPAAQPREKRSLVRRTFDLVVLGCWAGGVYVLVQQDSKRLTPQFVVLGVAAFLVPSVDAAVTTWRKQKFGEVTSIFLPLILAFGLFTDTKHLTAQPWWFKVMALVIGGSIIFVLAPMAVVLWRRTADERDRAITFTSMALALFATVLVAFAFSALTSMKMGPTLQADWVLYTAGGVWFASWLFLQRRM